MSKHCKVFKKPIKEDFNSTFKYGTYELECDAYLRKVVIRKRLEWNFVKHLRDGKRVWPSFKSYANRNGISMLGTDPDSYKQGFETQVLAYWNSGLYWLEATRPTPADPANHVAKQCSGNMRHNTLGKTSPTKVRIEFEIIDTRSDEHTDIEVQDSMARQGKPLTTYYTDVDGIHLDPFVTGRVSAHEIGHTLGLADEYDTKAAGISAVERKLNELFGWTDRTYFKDTYALMNHGHELRARYFFFVRDWLNKVTKYKYMFQVRPNTDAWDRKAPDAKDPAKKKSKPDWRDSLMSFPV